MKRLNFHPFLTLTAAARLAAEHNCELYVRWQDSKCLVEAIPLSPGAGISEVEEDWIPAFLRKQWDDEQSERVVKFCAR